MMGAILIETPRQADLIILAGRVSIKMAPIIRRLYDQMLEPKWAISMGACCSSMGVFNNYALVPADKFMPIDVHVPGCPPRPEALMHGVLKLRKLVQADPDLGWRERYGALGTEEKPLRIYPFGVSRNRLEDSIRSIRVAAVIVRSIKEASRLWQESLGLELETMLDIPQDKVRIAFLTVGESKVELVEPTDDTTGVARFLESKGEGFHHVCFEVANLAETLLRLEIDGLELIDSAPRRGAEGPVAFIHPRSCHGVLVELIEAPGGPAWQSLGF